MTSNSQTSITRRDVLATSVGVGVTGLAGCSGTDLSFTTNPSRFYPRVVDQTPYQLENAQKINIGELLRQNTEINAEFTAESYFVNYVHNQLPQMVINFATPSIKLVNKQVNPLATQDPKQIVSLLFSVLNRVRNDGFRIQTFEKVSEEQLTTSLGDRTLETYDVTAESDQFDEVVFTADIIIYEVENSVILTTGLTIQDIEGLSIDFAQEATMQRETIKQILKAVEYPVNWEQDVISQLNK